MATCLWTLLFLVALDAVVSIAFRYPTSNQAKPNALQIYFDYGRSIEAKLDRLLANSDANADAVAVAGWPDTIVRDIAPTTRPGKVGATFYGMSFSERIALAAKQIDPSLVPTLISGPAAPPNHSYACFLAERGRDRNRVQVWGILASSVPAMLTLTGMTTTFERPLPFTFPRYKLAADGSLYDVQPLLRSPNDMRNARRDPAEWQAFIEQLKVHDRFYDPWQMRAHALLDASTTLRLTRRAYAQQAKRSHSDELYTAKGFAEDPELGPVLARMIEVFGQRCRADGQLPIVILIQDRGSADALFRLAGPMLSAQKIPYLSTHEIVDPNNPLNFVSDGHFVPAADEAVARRLVELIRTQLLTQ